MTISRVRHSSRSKERSTFDELRAGLCGICRQRGSELYQQRTGGASNTASAGRIRRRSRLVGGRVGVRSGSLKAGFSDDVRQSEPAEHRRRSRSIGCASAATSPISSGRSRWSPSSSRPESTWTTVRRMIVPGRREDGSPLGRDPSNLFVYGVLTYDMSETLLRLWRAGVPRVAQGVRSPAASWRVVDIDRSMNVVLKLQYLHISNEFQGLSSFRSDRIQAGVSVMF